MERKLISIIIPVYNEEKNIPLLYDGLIGIFKNLQEKYDYEFIFVNDGSTDKSGEVITSLENLDEYVRFIDFSKNFGKEIATTAGLHHARGEAAIMIDCDMQHPVGIILNLIDKWEHGVEMVIGVRTSTKGNGFVKGFGSKLFYHIINKIGEIQIVPNATDYRLIDRIIIDEYNRFTERNRITRGLLDWLGFKKDYVYFEAEERRNGKASYNKIKLLKLALSAFVAHSLFPLKIAGYLGILIVVTSGPLGFFIFVEEYILDDYLGFGFSGPAQLAVINLFLVGVTLCSLGLIALYVGSIYNEVLNRPLYIMRTKKDTKK